MYEKKTMASQWLKQRQEEQGFLTDADFHAASVMEKEHLIDTYNAARNDEWSIGDRLYRTASQFFDEFFNLPFKSE
jgi:hypothetical protein